MFKVGDTVKLYDRPNGDRSSGVIGRVLAINATSAPCMHPKVKDSKFKFNEPRCVIEVTETFGQGPLYGIGRIVYPRMDDAGLELV